jgi:hypothetical protein
MYKYIRLKMPKPTMFILLITLGILGITGTSLAGKIEYDVTLYLGDDSGPVEATGTSDWPGLGVELRFSDNPTVTVDGIVMNLHGLYLTRKAGKIIAVSLFLNDVESGDLYRTRKVELDEEAQIIPVKGEPIELIIDKEASVYKKSKGKGGHSGETPMGEISIGTAIYEPQ